MAAILTDDRTKALTEVVRRFESEAFSYGAFDCCQFARRVIEAVTGRDVAAHLAYTGRDGADALIEKHGGLSALMCSVLGDPVPADQLRAADIAFVSMKGIPDMVAVMNPAGRALAPMPYGLEALPGKMVAHGWRIG